MLCDVKFSQHECMFRHMMADRLLLFAIIRAAQALDGVTGMVFPVSASAVGFAASALVFVKFAGSEVAEFDDLESELLTFEFKMLDLC